MPNLKRESVFLNCLSAWEWVDDDQNECCDLLKLFTKKGEFMAAGRKQVAFDLDTDALKTYYPSESWNNAYDVIRRHMTNNGFNWLQGSVYVSQNQLRQQKSRIY